MKPISSLQNPRFKSALKLHTSRGRTQQNRFIVFGERECRRAILSGLVPAEVYACTELLDTNALEWLQESVPNECSYQITPEMNAKLQYGSRTDGLAMVAERPVLELDSLHLESQSLVVVLEAIEKPGNLGAILRSCDGAGVNAVLTANPLTDFYHPNCIRASMGAVFSMSLGSGDTNSIQEFLRQNGFRGFVAVVDGTSPFHSTDFKAERCALVFGNEANGLSDSWRSEDWLGIKIPMRGMGDSLNVSVSVAIVAYEAANQRVK